MVLPAAQGAEVFETRALQFRGELPPERVPAAAGYAGDAGRRFRPVPPVAAKALARQQQWKADSAIARLMSALVEAAPVAVRHDRGKQYARGQFPEFRAWHALLPELFGIPAPDWTEKQPEQFVMTLDDAADDDELDEGADEDEESDDSSED